MSSSFYHMPAEWEPHEATWLSWPKDPITWPDRVFQAQEVFLQMIEILTPYEKVCLLVNDAEAKNEVLSRLEAKKITSQNLQIFLIPTIDAWIRDYGPIFVREKQGEDLKVLDWVFNAWGNKYEALKADDPIPKHLAPLLRLHVLEPGIVLEGGSIDVNGSGALLTTEQCLLNKNRNPHLSQKEIEEYLKKYLGAQKVLWLGEGIAGDDTDGHIDDITRFVAPNKIVTVWEDDPRDLNYKPLEDNVRRLKTMTDQAGKPFELILLPMPDPIVDEEGERLPASYANFYIANEVVLVPIFQQPKDEKALSILQRVFPTRKVVGIFCQDLVWGLGALHCVTQQQPKASRSSI